MAAPPFHLSLLLAFLLLSAAAAATTATAAHSQHLHLQHHGHGPPHHHRSPSMMTAPSMHQNRMESESESEETRQSLRVLNPVFTTVVDEPQAEETGSSESEAAAPSPVVDEPYRDAASVPPPPPVVDEPYRDAASAPPPPPVVDEPYRDAASPPPPVHDDAAGVSLQQIAKVLKSLGYNEMASSATLLADLVSAPAWPMAITVFAAPDVFLKSNCPECSRRHLLLDHMALGYFPYAELAAAPAMKLPSASVGFCLDVAAQPQRGPFSVHHASLYVNGVKVSEPERYDDGRYVVHGLHGGFIPPLSHASCVEDAHAHAHPHHQIHLHQHRHHHHLSARSAATSAATAASVVPIMIRETISRLRDSGYGFVALAMRVKFAELEKLSNLTVFALDDQVIFTGGGHGYVSAISFHIVPGHRLTRADLLRLHSGTVVPTMAGEDQKLVITRGASSATEETWINYIPLKEPDVAINSRVAVHGISAPFPRLHHLANLPASTTMTRPLPKRSLASAATPRHPAYSHGFRISGKVGYTAAAAAGLLGFAAMVVNQRRTERRRKGLKLMQAEIQSRRNQKLKHKPDLKSCMDCGRKEILWRCSDCGIKFCRSCVVNGFLDSHVEGYRREGAKAKFFCNSLQCTIAPLVCPEMDPVEGEYVLTHERHNIDNMTYIKTFVRLSQLEQRQPPNRLMLSYKKSDNTLLRVTKRSPVKKVLS